MADHSLPEPPYDDALGPDIPRRVMELHHGKHHGNRSRSPSRSCGTSAGTGDERRARRVAPTPTSGRGWWPRATSAAPLPYRADAGLEEGHACDRVPSAGAGVGPDRDDLDQGPDTHRDVRRHG